MSLDYLMTLRYFTSNHQDIFPNRNWKMLLTKVILMLSLIDLGTLAQETNLTVLAPGKKDTLLIKNMING